jgi:hypothetical protein
MPSLTVRRWCSSGSQPVISCGRAGRGSTRLISPRSMAPDRRRDAGGSAFVSGLLITDLAGAVAMGHIETARLVGQPLLVLAKRAVGHHHPTVDAGGTGRTPASWMADRARLRRHHAHLRCHESRNGRPTMVPQPAPTGHLRDAHGRQARRAYPGLTLVANTVIAMARPIGLSCLGGGRERPLIGPEAPLASPVHDGGAAGFIGAYARPLGELVQAAARWLCPMRPVASVCEPRRAGDARR